MKKQSSLPKITHVYWRIQLGLEVKPQALTATWGKTLENGKDAPDP